LVFPGGLLPGCPEFHIARREDPEVRALVGGVLDPSDARLDVEVEGLDRAVEAVGGAGEGADGSHGDIPFRSVRAAPFAASMAVRKTRDDRAAPRRGRNAMEGGRERLSWTARNGAAAPGEESRSKP